MKHLLKFAFSPAATAPELRESRSWILPFLILACGHALLLLADHAHTVDAVTRHLPPSADAADLRQVRDMLTDDLAPRLMLLPMRLAIGWFVFSGLLTFLVSSNRPEHPLSIKRAFLLEIHAEIALLIGGGVQFLWNLRAIGGGDTGRSTHPGALAYYISGTSMPVFLLLRSVNIFTLWYVVLLATGIHVLSNLTFRTSALVAAGAFALSTLFDAGVVSLLIEQFHFPV
jgi:hypothetical protein